MTTSFRRSGGLLDDQRIVKLLYSFQCPDSAIATARPQARALTTAGLPPWRSEALYSCRSEIRRWKVPERFWLHALSQQNPRIALLVRAFMTRVVVTLVPLTE